VKTVRGEILDQSLHFLMCFLIALLCMVGRVHIWTIPIALTIAHGFAMTREWYQHARLIWWSFDLAFCGAGAAAGAGVLFLI
jgi:hypothetical protein